MTPDEFCRLALAAWNGPQRCCECPKKIHDLCDRFTAFAALCEVGGGLKVVGVELPQ